MNYKNNKTGFTLIELLAVIVILAVIALIATPIIMGVINDAKKGAAKDSMYAYVKAVELATAKTLEPDTDLLSGPYQTKDGNLVSGSTLILTVDLKGTKPSNNSGDIFLTKGQVTKADLKFDGYCIGYDGEKATNKTCASKPTPTPTPIPTPPPIPGPPVAYTVGDEIYYNPELNRKCTAGEVNATANAKTGCLKWNVITIGDTLSDKTVDIMLDHNSTGKVEWNSSGSNTDGMKELKTSLQSDVTTWNASVKSSARLISGQELANIGEDTSWNAGNNMDVSYAAQTWLYSNLSQENTIEKSMGYWTSTASASRSDISWVMFYDGYLSFGGVTVNSYGVRPVITVPKDMTN